MHDLDIDLGICRIRPFRPDDAGGLARHANDREVWIHLADGLPHPYTLDDARAWLAMAGAQAGPPTNFAIEVGGEAAGSIGLKPDPGEDPRSAEVGYWVGRIHWGRGIATAAVGAVVAHAFARPGIDRIHACVFEGNPASARVLQKVGFRPQGRSPCGTPKAGRLVETSGYTLARGDQRPGSSPIGSRLGTGR